MRIKSCYGKRGQPCEVYPNFQKLLSRNFHANFEMSQKFRKFWFACRSLLANFCTIFREFCKFWSSGNRLMSVIVADFRKFLKYASNSNCLSISRKQALGLGLILSDHHFLLIRRDKNRLVELFQTCHIRLGCVVVLKLSAYSVEPVNITCS